MEVEDFLEHHGIKGQRWGIRRENLDRISRVAKGTGRVAKRVALATGRGARGTFRFARNHPKITASIVAGTAFTVAVLSRTGSTPVSDAKIAPFSASGKNWIVKAQDGRTFDMLVKTMHNVG